MSRTFGERINQFVLSIDLLDEDTFFDLLRLIHEYVRRHLDITYLSVLVETQIDEWQGLRTLWSTREEAPSYVVDEAVGAGYRSHSAYTYGCAVPIWVLSKSKAPLAGADDLVDEWSGAQDLPAYHSGNQKVYTSVMHPLRRDGRPVGVVEFAADGPVRPTAPSLAEVATLAQVISRAYRLYDVRELQQANTSQALNMLEADLTGQSWARLALPQLFVAYAGSDRLSGEQQGDHQALIDTMRSVIDEFDDHLTVTYWEDVTESGNIMDQVIRDIGESEYGICYLSEPSEEGGWVDNANVLFEAGMMQALTRSLNTPLRGWIPIREAESARIPFDIAAERMLVPDRSNGPLDSDAFADALRQRLARLVEIDVAGMAAASPRGAQEVERPPDLDSDAAVTFVPAKTEPQGSVVHGGVDPRGVDADVENSQATAGRRID